MMPERPVVDETKLLVAALAMHALLSRVNATGAQLIIMTDEISKQAVAQADSLLAELKKGLL